MPARSLLQIVLFVGDIDSTARFYRAVGVALSRVDTQSPTAFAEGGVNQTAVTLWPSGERDVTRVNLGFRVDSVTDVAAALDGLNVEYELVEPRPHLLRTQDPDGNQVHLVDVGCGFPSSMSTHEPLT
jgi:catechol 2,3-dioxygenase-like lactoylglutathione lyase family enzyme